MAWTKEKVGRCALLMAVWIRSPAISAAQHSPASDSSATCLADTACESQDTTDHVERAQSDQTDHPTTPEYPSLHLQGFGDFDLASQPKSEGARGFSEGQFVLHMMSELSRRVNFFAELSWIPRADGETGSPPAPTYNPAVERAFIRFDHSDLFKVSIGKFHTPINWWNTEFHHGQWLQTTISRPEMVEFGGKFIPVHFVGILVEGALPAGGWNVNYQAGVGNGRGTVISLPGDTGDASGAPAWVLNVFTKPDRAFGLRLGGSVYLDRILLPTGQEFHEHIVAAHAVWQKGNPEVIAEIASIGHEELGGSLTTSNLAYYVQAAYRLPQFGQLWKPYYRFEHVHIDPTDVVFQAVPNLDGSTFGVRYDISTYVALKGEYRVRQRVNIGPFTNGWFMQTSFTF